MSKGFIYIASPFSHHSSQTKHQRYLWAAHHLQSCLMKKMWAYSPIVHCYEISRMYDLPDDAESWKDYNETMMRAASELHVLQLPGWDKSLGVKHEIAFWMEHCKGKLHYVEWP